MNKKNLYTYSKPKYVTYIGAYEQQVSALYTPKGLIKEAFYL